MIPIVIDVDILWIMPFPVFRRELIPINIDFVKRGMFLQTDIHIVDSPRATHTHRHRHVPLYMIEWLDQTGHFQLRPFPLRMKGKDNTNNKYTI